MSAILINVLALRRGEFIRLACEDGRMNSPLRQSDRAKSVSDRIRISELMTVMKNDVCQIGLPPQEIHVEA